MSISTVSTQFVSGGAFHMQCLRGSLMLGDFFLNSCSVSANRSLGIGRDAKRVVREEEDQAMCAW